MCGANRTYLMPCSDLRQKGFVSTAHAATASTSHSPSAALGFYLR